MKLQMRARASVTVLIGVLLLTACQKQPGGQVVAVVGDEEVTLNELRAETRRNVPATGPEAEAANVAALQKLVDRNVLANYARTEGLDRLPEYIERRRQFDQTLLAALAIRKLVGQPSKPSDADVQAFIAANPTLFAGRQRLSLDQIRIAKPNSASTVKALTDLQNMDEIAARLQAQGTPFQRGPAVLDTASIDPGIGKQIVALPNGEVFDINREGSTYITAITGRSPVPPEPAAWPPAAAATLQQQRAAAKVEAEVTRLKQAAGVRFDPAYKPKAAGS